MRKILKGLGLAGALLAVPAGSAAAQQQMMCDGALWGVAADEVCVISAFTLSNSGSTLNMFVFNGGTVADGASNSTMTNPSRITAVGVGLPGSFLFGGSFTATYFDNGVGSNVNLGWASTTNFFVADLEAGSSGGISTCGGPANPGPLYQTCDRPGGTLFGPNWDYMLFSWTLNSPMSNTDLADIQWGWKAQSVGPTGGPSYECITGFSIVNGRPTEKLCEVDLFPDDPGTPTEVVPEPATMALLATGLAGMAAAGTRRRKREREQQQA